MNNRNNPMMNPGQLNQMNTNYPYTPSTPYAPTYGYDPQQGFKPEIMTGTTQTAQTGYGPGLVYGPYQYGPTDNLVTGLGYNPTPPYYGGGFNQPMGMSPMGYGMPQQAGMNPGMEMMNPGMGMMNPGMGMMNQGIGTCPSCGMRH